jgi:hypothetical protein
LNAGVSWTHDVLFKELLDRNDVPAFS